MYYNNAINRLKDLNNMKHKLRQALGNIGIYLPLETSMEQVLFCIYFYYMFNLFSDNNSNWKEKYFPLDGATLYNFIEGDMTADPTTNNKKYIDIANEIEAVTYPSDTEQSGNVILNRGLLERFNSYNTNSDLKNKIGEISNNSVNTDNVLTSTQGLLSKLLSIWKWKKYVIEGTRRKRKEDNQTSVIEENALLDDILQELRKEPRYSLPRLKLDKIKLTNKDLNINSSDNNYRNALYPFTIYNTPTAGSVQSMSNDTKRLFSPHNWTYNSKLNIDNIRPNTKLSLYYKQKPDPGQFSPHEDFFGYLESDTFNNTSWDKITKTEMNLLDLKISDRINIGYKDKYNGIYDKNNGITTAYSYLGWKPEVFLYSKGVARETYPPYGPRGGYKTNAKDSPMDHMNLLDNDDFGNLGLTILVPSIVEKYMKEKVPVLNLNDGYDGSFNSFGELRYINLIRNMETVFLVGIYPVDENDNIIYKDPIAFQFFSGEQLNDDLGLSFADYRKIKSPTTKDNTLLRKYYNLKIGQMFYRNNYSRVSTEKRITNVMITYNEATRKFMVTNITYDTIKIGDLSKNMLYLYGRDNYLPYVGKTAISPGQNHNITNPDDNTNISNINIAPNIEYTFKKYGNTKVAVQLYMATNNNSNMNGLEYFTKIKNANGGIIDDNTTESSETLTKIPGSYLGLPYYNESKWEMGVNTIKNKAFPYGETDIIETKIPYPDYTTNNDSRMSFESTLGLSYITEPVIIDCNKSDEYNAPWLDKRNAPYVAKVVTEDFDHYSEKRSSGEISKVMKKGIYIKIPNELNLYMLNDESVKKNERRKRQSNIVNKTIPKDKEFYGRITRDKYIRAIKNALLGITVNYNPASNTTKNGTRNPSWFKTDEGTRKFFNDSRYYDIVEDGKDLYIRLDGNYFEDLEYAGLGFHGTVKVQLIFRNEFFRSDDPNSPLNYKFVPTTGDVQLLREIAGQRIKLYRGGILAHPTDYANKNDRSVFLGTFGRSNRRSADVSRTKEIAYKHFYTEGFPTFAMDSDRLVSVTNKYSYITLSDDNSVYDIISIEMDYPHWQELQVNNIERSPISSMETDTNENSLPIPINVLDLENYDFLEYDIPDNSYINEGVINRNVDNRSMYPKLTLKDPSDDRTPYVEEYIDFYRMLNFWYIFRPKVKLFNEFGERSRTEISVETYNDWKTRILNENREYFNKKNMKVSETQNRVVDLEDILNIRCYKNYYSVPELNNLNTGEYTKVSDSDNLYNIMKYIILNHTIYIDRNGNTNVERSFNPGNFKKSKFGGYVLDKLLYSDWVFTYRKGDSKKVDDVMRQSANDTALYLFNMHYYVNNQLKEKYRQSIPSGQIISNQDYVRETFEKFLYKFMTFGTMNNLGNIHNIYDNSNRDQYLTNIKLPGNKRLLDFKANNNCELKQGYNKGNVLPDTSMSSYNVWDKRLYKGDNRKLDTSNSKAKLRRGFRMGDKTPDNPFMGFSMPATSSPESVPDHIHLIYCDVYWKDFDKTQALLTTQSGEAYFSVSLDKNVISMDNSVRLTYDFTGFIEKYNLNVWKAKGKHVIFRILVDEPTNERHKDCPDYIIGEYYDNKNGKGFSPNFKNEMVRLHYKFAILAFRRWINEHNDIMDKFIYTIELPLGTRGDGTIITGGNITTISDINNIYQSVYNDFYGYNFMLVGDRRIDCKLVFSSSVNIVTGELIKPYGWSFSNLGNREHFEEWMKYNMYGSYYIIGDSIAGGSMHGGNINSTFYNTDKNKFKALNTQHNGFSGVIRSDLSMEELMKPENFKELLYEMKTITPMYVIGYVDKERYHDQYEALMNEMGYKYTITSAVIEDDYLKVYYSNEGKNGIKSISNTSNLAIFLQYKNTLKNIPVNTSVYELNRIGSRIALNIPKSTHPGIDYTKINTGDVRMFRTNTPMNINVNKPYISGRDVNKHNSVERAYGKNMVDDVYLELRLQTDFNEIMPIKLANVNRTTEINLTDSGLLHMFITNYKNEESLSDWFENMYFNHIKIDDNGWI